MTNITLKLSNLFFLNWTKKYQDNWKWFKFTVYGTLFLLFLIWYIAIMVIPIIYLGIIITRKRLIKRLKSFIRTRSLINRIILSVICIIVIFIIVIAIFTWIIIALLFIGNYIENKKYSWKIKETKPDNIFSDSKEKDDLNVFNKVNLPLKRGY